MGTERGGSVLDPPGPSQRKAIAEEIAQGTYSGILIPDFNGKVTTTYNQIVMSEYTRLFLEWLSKTPRVRHQIPDELMDEEQVQVTFVGHVFNCVKRRWKKQKKGLSEEDLNTMNIANAREQRRKQVSILNSQILFFVCLCLNTIQLFKCRSEACKRDPKQKKTLQDSQKYWCLWHELGRRSVQPTSRARRRISYCR